MLLCDVCEKELARYKTIGGSNNGRVLCNFCYNECKEEYREIE